MTTPKGQSPTPDPPYDAVYEVTTRPSIKKAAAGANGLCLEIEVKRIEGSTDYINKNMNLFFSSDNAARIFFEQALAQL